MVWTFFTCPEVLQRDDGMADRNLLAIICQACRFLVVPGAMALTAIPFCLVEKDTATMVAFSITAATGLLIAGIFRLVPVKNGQGTPHAMATVALAWLAVGAWCGLPLYLAARAAPVGSELVRAYGSAIDAFFEGISGVTSCGLTLSARPDLLPLSVQWWRSLCEWVGGVGVVVLMLVLIEPAEHHDAFYRAEARSWRLEDSLHKTALRIWSIFVGLSVCSVIGLRLAGAPWWEALNHGMTAIATGGFTIRAGSFRDVAPVVQWTAMLFMAMGAFSFRTYHRLLVDRLPPWRQSTQLRWLAALMLTGAAALAGITHLEKIDATRTQTVFQWISALGTCGFTAVDLSQWGPAAMLILILGMVVGGASGSTTGGIKIARLVWLSKNAVKHLQNRMNDSNGPEIYRYNGRKVEPKKAIRCIRYAALLAGLWCVGLIGGWLVLLLAMPAAPPMHLFFEAASALGSVGLSSGVTRPEMPAAAKGGLAFLMWIGRLEIISAVMLFTAPLRLGGHRGKESADKDERRGHPHHAE